MKPNHIKHTITILLALAAVSCGAPEQKLKIRVTDESGKPIKDAACMAGWWKDNFIHGTSDADGIVEFTGRTGRYETLAKANVPGYYQSEQYKFMMTGTNGLHWEPWPVEVNLVMKKIIRPHPMHVLKLDGERWLDFPDKKLGPFGFDLMAGEWIAPYGKGKVADFILEGRKDDPNDESTNPKGKIILTFSNPGDGIRSVDDKGGSLLVGPAVAPEGGYQSRWEFVNLKPNAKDPTIMNWDFRGEVYVFQVRSQFDETGKVKSALYGKMDGRIVCHMSQHAPLIEMTCYMNGTFNDRSLEWDLKTNLIPETKRRVNAKRP